ncbi:hypothetical protein GCM10009554_13410 [Kribbella koreensis]|uniref:Lipoprotein n=1 Tax=Kribbella koreensis TaxID=57909 RepID=A0ABN1PNK1_9ACTN
MKIRVTLAVLVLGGLTLLTGCGDKDTSKAAAPPPATSQPQTTEPQSEDTPTAAESEESKPAASGDAKEFCKKLASKAEDMGTGKQASELSDDQLQKVKETIEDLAEDAPADLKPSLEAMLPLYDKAKAGTLPVEDQKKAAAASLKYVEWLSTNCDPADFGH